MRKRDGNTRIAHRLRRGFTLIELLVAVVAGLLVAAAAVSFSRQSTRFFAQEARIASAQMSVLAGFQRLQADVSRAGYMSTTDMTRDYNFQRLCAPQYGAWPEAMRTLTSLKIDSTSPNKIRVAGNLASSEMFPVRAIEPSGGGHNVYLQVNNGPMTRAGFLPSDTDSDAAFKNVFRPGRLLRILDDQGKFEFEVIKTSSYVTFPVITTNGPLPLRGELSMATSGGVAATSAPCGIGGFGVGVLASPISVVEYQIANVSTVSPYKETIYHADYKVAAADDNRTELVRNELLLTNSGTEWVPSSASEIVAEFGVDLRVGVWTTRNPSGCTAVGKLFYCAPGANAAATTLPATTDAPGLAVTGPTAIRSLDLRLVVRSREADRGDDITNAANPLVSEGFMFRAPMPNGRFARARTLSANVALMNHRGDAW
ncbi:MAG: hypothetical protein CVU63_11235 [Deltaproteobacteria bacterium HGW-Deltaproteobacteria-20]|nr:MAG: hypothetical protein CVU63_11235 [Deltaproteobacteria bacterium HGW-Deltaproteobacteria-20]